MLTILKMTECPEIPLRTKLGFTTINDTTEI